MLYFQGRRAHTPCSLQKKLEALQLVQPQLSALEVYSDYFIEVSAQIDPIIIRTLEQLLPSASYIDKLTSATGLEVWVVPRVGTLSPWSSKATEIAKICGIQQVTRIEHGYRYVLHGVADLAPQSLEVLHDPLTESIIKEFSDLDRIFQQEQPAPIKTVAVIETGVTALTDANDSLGLSLSTADINYLMDYFLQVQRNPTDAELMMFAQVNSEHCRHKIFNAEWEIDGSKKPHSLFEMVRNTHQISPQQVLVAYKDNAAVMQGGEAEQFLINPKTQRYETSFECAPFVLKVETHNHPTAISPFPGAATGCGGEIRDEAATGRGAKTKAGLCGFSVSHLRIPNFIQPWEKEAVTLPQIASPLQIMLEGPVGAASFNNEFGRPNLLGYFRNFSIALASCYGSVLRGYAKPIMIAGGLGSIRRQHVQKEVLAPDALIIVLGGPAMAIGLGGGSASSRDKSEENQVLDFASVQRANPEMQRRVQEVINVCAALGPQNPLLSIHDVGAGGLSNALPELVHDSELGGEFSLRAIPSSEPGMSPVEIWCNEAQERYVLAINAEALQTFSEIARRERAPFAVVGKATKAKFLTVKDPYFNNHPVGIPMEVLFEKMPRMKRQDQHTTPTNAVFNTDNLDLSEAIKRVLQFPCVASKSFLITIGDRSVGGLVARDQCVGPWQVPVADCAVTCSSFNGYQGEALAVGERAPVALLHHAASARMALGEAITNIAAAAIEDISDIVLSANWMAAADYPGEGAGLYDAVQALGMELCPALKIAIPVGKDSLSMRTTWEADGQHHSVTAPLSLVISAAAKVSDVRATLTPQLQSLKEPTCLLLIDLGGGANLLGASVLLQAYEAMGTRTPDVDEPRLLANFFKAIQLLNREKHLLAYHDRSDGGLLACVCEMLFAGHVGVDLCLDTLGDDPIASLFTEELGAVLQVKQADLAAVLELLSEYGLGNYSHVIGELNSEDALVISYRTKNLYRNSRTALQRLWSETSYRMQAIRDNQACAKQEYDRQLQSSPGLRAHLTFAFDASVAPTIITGAKPKIAILREQGVNGHIEMAAAFERAGFACFDVHMSDLLEGRCDLQQFRGMAACGGFSYGDVLGAGRGWAQSILMQSKVRDQFTAFFERSDTFTVGVCNGCQMLTYLRDIIPGAIHWPYFTRNISEQFEARLVQVKVMQSPSILFQGMSESVLPIVVSHGEGYAKFANDDREAAQKAQLVSLQYVDPQHRVTELYPDNPNGSEQGITSLTTLDGRVTIIMPHPERVFRSVQLSWYDPAWGENSPWMKLFYNARAWV